MFFVFSLLSLFTESEKHLYLLGSEPWTRRSADECRGPRTAETDCRKNVGTKAFMTSFNDMYTDRSHKHTVNEELLFMEMISQKAYLLFSHSRNENGSNSNSIALYAGWSLNYQTWHFIKSGKLRPIWWPQLKRYMNESHAYYLFLLVFWDSGSFHLVLNSFIDDQGIRANIKCEQNSLYTAVMIPWGSGNDISWGVW